MAKCAVALICTHQRILHTNTPAIPDDLPPNPNPNLYAVDLWVKILVWAV